VEPGPARGCIVITAYRAARTFDGLSEQIIEDGVVLVEDGRIVSVGAPQKPPPGAGVVDLGDATLLPGLIDAHVHLVWSASAEPHEVVQQEGRALTALRCAKNAALHLRAGVTTVRDVGATDGLSIDVARAVELGVLPGPRVIAAGRAIAMTGGHGWFLRREADGAEAVRHAVRSELKAGATCIKLMASGGVYGHAEEPGSPQLTVAEMHAGTEEAHKAGRRVAAHAYSAEAIANALDAGVDSIEHGSFIDRDTARRMRASGHPHGTLPEELRLMVESGASPIQALCFGTSAAADLPGLGDEVGSLEPGKRADLLALDGDPTSAILALREVRLVVRDGSGVEEKYSQDQLGVGV
jgi:imidazolonepropionase-like amidohydrolase